MENLLEAFTKRMGSRLPDPQPSAMRMLARTSRAWIIRYLGDRRGEFALSPMGDARFKWWLANTSYSGAEKTELSELRVTMMSRFPRNNFERECVRRGLPVFRINGRDSVCSTFVKSEFYRDWPKSPRNIAARGDCAAIFFGPFVKMLEEVLYHVVDPRTGREFFIKLVPKATVPSVLEELDALRLDGRSHDWVIGTDYTAFESSVKVDMYRCTQQKFYNWMVGLPWNAELGDYPDLSVLTDSQFIALAFQRMCTGMNRLDMGWFSAEIRAVRMSGEMDTSLGNGFVNLMIINALQRMRGFVSAGFVEGDDGVFVGWGPCPSEADYASFGCKIKIERPQHISDASFCGNVYDKVDLIPTCDPRWFMIRFGWCHDANAAYMTDATKRGLVRARAMSGLAQYAGCPIVTSACRYAIRATTGATLKWSASGNIPYKAWDVIRDLPELTKKIGSLVTKPVPRRTRELVNRIFGISCEDQVRCENYFDSLPSRLVPLRPPVQFPAKYKQLWTDLVDV